MTEPGYFLPPCERVASSHLCERGGFTAEGGILANVWEINTIFQIRNHATSVQDPYPASVLLTLYTLSHQRVSDLLYCNYKSGGAVDGV